MINVLRTKRPVQDSVPQMSEPSTRPLWGCPTSAGSRPPTFFITKMEALKQKLSQMKLYGTWRTSLRCRSRLGQGQETHLRSLALVNESNSFWDLLELHIYFSYLSALHNVVQVFYLPEVSTPGQGFDQDLNQDLRCFQRMDNPTVPSQSYQQVREGLKKTSHRNFLFRGYPPRRM